MNNVKQKICVFCTVWASSYRHFGGLYCHQNISTHLLSDTASCPRRLESSARESKDLGGVTPICVYMIHSQQQKFVKVSPTPNTVAHLSVSSWNSHSRCAQKPVNIQIIE